MLEQAMSEMRGEAPPSTGAQGAERAAQTASAGGKAVKRKLQVRFDRTVAVCSLPVSRVRLQAELDDDGCICAECLSQDDPHPLVDGRVAVQLGLITESYREHNLTCAYTKCPFAQENKDQKCGEGSKRMQRGKARVQAFCMHPHCLRGFHPTCYSIAHRMMPHIALLPKPVRKNGRR